MCPQSETINRGNYITNPSNALLKGKSLKKPVMIAEKNDREKRSAKKTTKPTSLRTKSR